MAGLPTTAGCPVVAEMADPAVADAAVVASAREAGARIVGKTGLTELCWSASGINHWAGTPVNPRDPRRLPGGSSSGSAVAVATGEADVAFGTDTGGSVRVPAACCAVVGLKTRHGRIPVKGVYPLAPSLDTVGPIGPDVAAVEVGMRLLEPGFLVPDATGELIAGRITVPASTGGADPAVDAAVDRALAAAGVAVTRVPGLGRRRGAQRYRRAHRRRGVQDQRLPDAVPQAAQPARAAQPGARRPAHPRRPGGRGAGQDGGARQLRRAARRLPRARAPDAARPAAAARRSTASS